MKPSFHFAKHALRRILGAAALLPMGLFAQTFFQPYGSVFTPSGLDSAPWTLLNAAVSASNGGEVKVLGGLNLYGPTRIDRKCKLTRNPGDGAVKIGATPVRTTTFRSIAYNARLNGQAGSVGAFNYLPYGWADQQRTEAIRAKIGNYGADFAGFCEVWNSDWWDSNGTGLKYMGGMPHGMTGFDYKGFGTHHSGLCAASRHPISSPAQVAFSNYTGEDANAAKGWIQGVIDKDGQRILLIMTHTQADSSFNATWDGIFTARKQQAEQLRGVIESFRSSNPSAVVILMGDFNVYGDDRTPSNSTPLTTEYSSNLKPALTSSASPGAVGGNAPRDVARQFLPQKYDHTYSYDPFWGENSLIKYFDSSYATPTYSGRLDYFLIWNSWDGKVLIEPTNYEVLKLMSDSPIEGRAYPGLWTNKDSNLSDHYAILGDFRITQTSN